MMKKLNNQQVWGNSIKGIVDLGKHRILIDEVKKDTQGVTNVRVKQKQ